MKMKTKMKMKKKMEGKGETLKNENKEEVLDKNSIYVCMYVLACV